MVKIKFGQKFWSHFFKILTLWYHSRDHFKNVDCSTFSLTIAKFDLSINNRPLKRHCFISIVTIKFGQKSWSQSFKILIFWYQWRDNFQNVDCSTSGLIYAQFDLSTNKQPPKENPFISMARTKCGQKSWSHFFKISTFLYQSRDHLKNVRCSTSSLIFAKFDILANKPLWKKKLLYIDG